MKFLYFVKLGRALNQTSAISLLLRHALLPARTKYRPFPTDVLLCGLVSICTAASGQTASEKDKDIRFSWEWMVEKPGTATDCLKGVTEIELETMGFWFDGGSLVYDFGSNSKKFGVIVPNSDVVLDDSNIQPIVIYQRVGDGKHRFSRVLPGSEEESKLCDLLAKCDFSDLSVVDLRRITTLMHAHRAVEILAQTIRTRKPIDLTTFRSLGKKGEKQLPPPVKGDRDWSAVPKKCNR